MGSFANYTEAKVLDHITGKTSFTMPTAYIGLSTADPTDDASGLAEPSGGGYARITTSGASWDAASGGATANAAALSFPESSGAWAAGAPLTHFAIFDAASAGNMLAHGSLTTPRTVDAAGITLSFAIGELDITLD